MKTRPHDAVGDHNGTHAPAAPRGAWAQFELLVANLRDGITVQDGNGRIVYANVAGANLCGYATPAELIAAPPGDFLQRFEMLDSSRARIRIHELPGRKALQLGVPAEALLLVRERATGIERWSEVRSFAVADRPGHPTGQSTFVVNVFRDVSELLSQQRQLEEQAEELEEQTAQAQSLAEALEQANDDLSAALLERAEAHREAVVARESAEQSLAWLVRLQHLTVVLSRALLPADVIHIALNAGRTSFGADRASVWQIDHGAAAILLLGQSGYTGEIEAQYASIPLDAPIMQADCARTGEPILISDQSSMEEHYPFIVSTIRAVNAHAVALFPIRVGGGVIGVLSFSYGAPREFSRDFIVAGRTFAKELGQAFDRTHAHAALEVARQAADAASQAKSAFLATMSHELRTPINAILGFTDLLRLGVSSGEAVSESEYLTRIHRNTEHLLELVNDVLDWAKVEAGQLVVESKRAEAKDVIGDALNVVREQAAARGLSLTSSCDSGASYVGDAMRVRQILLNLLSNAVKFTMAGGGVRLTCGARGPVTEFVVEDTGIGVAPDELVRIFEPFVQAEGGYTRPHGGTGLGLSISRRLARMMNGDVTAESERGKGSRFVLTLPSGGDGYRGPEGWPMTESQAR